MFYRSECHRGVAHDFQVGVKKYVTEELGVLNSYDTWHGKYKDIATPGCYHALIRSSAYTRNKECGEGCGEGWSGKGEG